LYLFCRALHYPYYLLDNKLRHTTPSPNPKHHHAFQPALQVKGKQVPENALFQRPAGRAAGTSGAQPDVKQGLTSVFIYIPHTPPLFEYSVGKNFFPRLKRENHKQKRRGRQCLNIYL
jgi:hypothetical protein